MNYIILIIVGIAGVVLGTYLGRRRSRSLNETQNKEREDIEKKRENLEKVREYFESRPSSAEATDGQARVANDDIEVLLGVSYATATRYLDEFEKEGRIRQVGRTGRHVYYERV